MSKLKCYYAHTMLSYGSNIELKDIETLLSLNFDVINPNCPEIREDMKAYVELYGKERTMDFFKDIVRDCDVIAFRALPSGQILSGVGAEVLAAIDEDIPVIELPCNLNKRMLSYPETREFLKEIGFYKVF